MPILLAFFLVFVGGTEAARHHINPYHHGQEDKTEWSNEWVVYLRSGDMAELLAEELGLTNRGEISGFPGHFLLELVDQEEEQEQEEERLERGVNRENRDLTLQLLGDLRVGWAEQQFPKIRVKRGPWSNERQVDHQQGSWNRRDLRQLYQNLDEKSIPPELLEIWREEENYKKPSPPQAKKSLFNDELWDHQWYLHDTRSREGLPDISLHVLGAWESGLSGQGVRVVILDDGLEHSHPDLEPNYDSSISYDFNDDDLDPAPRDVVNSHGTRCAGEVAMLANNNICGVGVAFNATIGGVRILDGKISDQLEARALSFALDKVDIFSSSWGPNDDGTTVEGPGRLATAAIQKGIQEGRGGKGVIYVWASGNGGSRGDDCNCDGYTASIYTLSVSSASQQGSATWYGESCPSTLTSAYSSGAYTDQKIATTDNGGGCTLSHTGTSAAAPLVAGMLALVLEAAPELTWRDVQYLTLITSDPAPLLHNPGWKRNGVGLLYNPSFGFGVMDGESIVRRARDWPHVPPAKLVELLPAYQNKTRIADLLGMKGEGEMRKRGVGGKGGEVLQFEFQMGEKEDVRQLEHVQLSLTVVHPERGDLDVVLRSPLGTTTRLLAPRPLDKSDEGLYDWALMSVETWGENPAGNWNLYIADRGEDSGRAWRVEECRLTLHGTEDTFPLNKSPGKEKLENKSKITV